MAWKGLHLTKPSRLYIKNKQLVVFQDDEEVTVPLEDIAWIILDNLHSSCSVSCISSCAEHGIVIIISDHRHLPCAISLPFHQHYKTAGIAQLQLSTTMPLKKRIWQTIVKHKILNQAGLLSTVQCSHMPPLREMAKRVDSGDTKNIEAQAAKAYWSVLFDDFNRNNNTDDLRNKALNYAYAVLRGCLARSITACGLLPAIGIHHDSISNAFNLVDDLIEPFRPFADSMVLEKFKDRLPEDEFTTQDRQYLAGLPNLEISINNQTITILHASELVVQSFVRTLENDNIKELALPKFKNGEKGG